MFCKHCGKENHKNSKFCHSCGISLQEESLNFSKKKNLAKNFKIDWKNPIVLILAGLILIGCLTYGGIKIYAYYQVESKISTAEKLQKNKDYTGSLNILNTLDFNSGTDDQKTEITKLKEDNKKFSDYKTLFDTIIIKVSSTSSVDDLKLAQTDLQSIDSTYPDYESVRNKLSESNTLLLAALENDSAVNKALAEKNKQAAASAQAAKNKAEQNAKSAADEARVEEVLKSFSNQLLAIRNNFSKFGVDAYISYIKAYNEGDYSLSKIYGGGVLSVCYSTQTSSKALRNTFTGLPVTYENASINLEWAGFYLCKSMMSWVDGDFNSSKEESDKMFDYYYKVDTFLSI